MINITVIGAGHGGKAMAAELASRGFPVTLYNRTYAHIETIALRGGIELMTEDNREVFGPLRKVTSDLAEATAEADLIMVVLPASAHRPVGLSIGPHLRDGQVVVLNPGRTGGALEFAAAVREGGGKAQPIICEAETFIFASRSVGPSEARIFRTKFSIPVAAFPATYTQQALQVIQQAYPQFIPAKNVLYTSLNNMGAVFHPSLVLLNAGWIEATHGDFEFYMDGVTPGTARVLEALDRERVTVAMALGVRAQTAMEWLYRAYAAEGNNLYEAMHANPGYGGIKAPNRLDHRYIFEDVPCSLVPISELGRHYGVATPTIDAMIHLANMVHSTDYRARGRTIKTLGIQGMSIQELHHYVETGQRW